MPESEREPFQLGIFMPNCSHAYCISSYKPEPDDWTYESNKNIAQAAEAAGFDFLFPVSRWRGFGGETNYLRTSLETMTWAAAILAATQTIRVYSTVHVPVFHPLVAAKMGGTLDHIGQGRWGINIVSGWSATEFGMMGIELLPHAERYQRTAAFIEILKGLWTQEPGSFTHVSPWYQITDGYVMPQPMQQPHPPIVNAGTSDAARDLVARLCDWGLYRPAFGRSHTRYGGGLQATGAGVRPTGPLCGHAVCAVARNRKGSPGRSATDHRSDGYGCRPELGERPEHRQ